MARARFINYVCFWNEWISQIQTFISIRFSSFILFCFMFFIRNRLRYLHKKKPEKPDSAGRFHYDMTAEHFENVGVIQSYYKNFSSCNKGLPDYPAPPGSWFGKKGWSKGKSFIHLHNAKITFFSHFFIFYFLQVVTTNFA